GYAATNTFCREHASADRRGHQVSQLPARAWYAGDCWQRLAIALKLRGQKAYTEVCTSDLAVYVRANPPAHQGELLMALTTKETARRLNVSVWTLYRLVKEGRIQPVRLLRRRLRFTE